MLSMVLRSSRDGMRDPGLRSGRSSLRCAPGLWVGVAHSGTFFKTNPRRRGPTRHGRAAFPISAGAHRTQLADRVVTRPARNTAQHGATKTNIFALAGAERTQLGRRSVAAFEDGHERFLGDVDGADPLHALLALFLFLEE